MSETSITGETNSSLPHKPKKGRYLRVQYKLVAMLIRSTAHPSYCPSALLSIRPTATSDLRQLFIFVIFDG